MNKRTPESTEDAPCSLSDYLRTKVGPKTFIIGKPGQGKGFHMKDFVTPPTTQENAKKQAKPE